MKKRGMVIAGVVTICMSVLFPVKVKANDTVEVYRLYNMNSGEHFYTVNAKERDTLKNAGWLDEGTLGTAPITSKTPVYRAYNPAVGDHVFTTDTNEIASIVSVGWKNEGIAFYSDDNHSVEIQRQYNPNAVTGTHNYTTDAGENQNLLNAGWSGEGTVFYAAGPGRANPNYKAEYDALMAREKAKRDAAEAAARAAAEAAARAAATVHGSDIVNTARYWIGRGRYAMGGTNPATGIDCSKFTQYCFAQHGISIAGVAAQQASNATRTNNPQPGDLVLWTSHAAIYSGNGKIIAATNPRQGIKESYISSVRTPGRFMGYFHVNGVSA